MNCVFAYTNEVQEYKSSLYQSIIRAILQGDVWKLGFLITFFVVILAVYTITVNISSTEGYYYAKALKEKEKIEFQYNITKLNVMTMQSDLRNQMTLTNQHQQGQSVKEIMITK